MKFYSLSEETIKIIERNIQKLLRKARPKCVLLIEKSGYIITSKSEVDFKQPENMGAIAAGILTALQSTVSFVNATELTITFHNSSVDRIHFVMLTPKIFLVVLYDNQTPLKKMREGIKEFAKIIRQQLIKDETHPPKIDSVQFINEKLDEIFKDVLR